MAPRLSLSIRQPYAELILRGVKTIEYRSRPTRIIGQRFYIDASRQSAMGNGEWAIGHRNRRFGCSGAIADARLPTRPTGVIVHGCIIEIEEFGVRTPLRLACGRSLLLVGR